MLRRSRSRLPIAIVVGCLFGVIAATIPVAAANTKVSIVDLAFRPKSVTIKQGDVVTWTNDGARGHTVTAQDGSFDSGTLSPGDEFANLFDKPGTFAYHCTIHSSMQGTVVVKAVSATPAASDVTPPPGTRPPDLATPDLGANPTGSPSTPGAGGAADYGGIALIAIALGVTVAGSLVWIRRRPR